MKELWREFKAFALGGNMLDLALGFIIGAGFATVVKSLANNILMQLVAAIFGKPDFTALKLRLNDAEIGYGAFLTDFISFFLLGTVLFGLVKLLKKAGLGNFRDQGQRECPWCKEFVPINALRCKWCTGEIDPAVLTRSDSTLLRDRAHAEAERQVQAKA